MPEPKGVQIAAADTAQDPDKACTKEPDSTTRVRKYKRCTTKAKAEARSERDKEVIEDLRDVQINPVGN